MYLNVSASVQQAGHVCISVCVCAFAAADMLVLYLLLCPYLSCQIR